MYCTDLLGAPIPSDTCGGIGAFCSDPGLVSAYMGDPATVVALGSETCAGSADGTNYCSYQGGVCAAHVTTIGGDCSFDPMFACSQTAAGQDLICQNGQTCQLATVPSGRARARRNEALFKRNVCPASHTACSIDGQKGFECIDTQSNIEQCTFSSSAGTQGMTRSHAILQQAVLAPRRAVSTAPSLRVSTLSAALPARARSGPARTTTPTTPSLAPAWPSKLLRLLKHEKRFRPLPTLFQ